MTISQKYFISTQNKQHENRSNFQFESVTYPCTLYDYANYVWQFREIHMQVANMEIYDDCQCEKNRVAKALKW